MTALGLVVLVSALVGVGLVAVVWSLVPARPDPKFVLDQIAPQTAARGASQDDESSQPVSGWDRVGLAVMRSPAANVLAVPARDLAVLRRSTHWYYGQVAAAFLTGVLAPTVLTVLGALVALTGLDVIRPPALVPVGAALLFGVMLALVPRGRVHTAAQQARDDFGRAVGAYIDIVIVESRAGSLPRQALERAAEVGESWVFVRIREVLRRSRWSGQAPWDSLHELADDLGVPDLADMANKVQLAGAQGAPIADQLQASVASMRATRVSRDIAAANRRAGILSAPVSVLVLVFMLILITPIILRFLGGTT